VLHCEEADHRIGFLGFLRPGHHCHFADSVPHFNCLTNAIP
jgi:hypothetical protein